MVWGILLGRITRVWAGVISAWEQDAKCAKAMLREMPENATNSHPSSAYGFSLLLCDVGEFTIHNNLK